MSTREIGTSGAKRKSPKAAEDKASTMIVVSRGTFLEFGGGPNTMSTPLIAER